MRIALVGTRGVPANYGGFETCVEELGKRLVKRGHQVTVYCRKSYYTQKLSDYQGMNLVYLPNLKKRSLDTLSHTLLSVIHSITKNYDLLMVFNSANSPTLIIPKLFGKRIAINTDGLEWKRGKWGPVARFYYKVCERLATIFANRVVADSRGIQEYYLKEYGISTTFIPYGAYITQSKNPQLLHKLGVASGDYFLQITRFEPENNPLLSIKAYKQLNTKHKLVVVGGVPYESDYSRAIIAEAFGHQNIILPGPIYDKELLNEMWCNCYAYIHGNEVGGTNPALLQAMASGCFTIAIDVSFNQDVLQQGGIYFNKTSADLAIKMQWAIDNSSELVAFKKTAIQRIHDSYSWDTVTNDYEKMFFGLMNKQPS